MPMQVDGLIIGAGGDRGSEPDIWQHATMKPAVIFSWHHTVPWNCLRAVWNGLVRGQHWNALDEYLQLVGATPPTQNIIAQLKNHNLLLDRDVLHTKLTWQGWNIVEGPGERFRLEDPGEAFENWSYVGMSNNQKATHQAIKILYRTMEKIADQEIAAGTEIRQVSAGYAKDLQKAFTEARGTLRGKAPIPWNEQIWDVVTKGKVNKTRPAIWDTSPQWRHKPS